MPTYQYACTECGRTFEQFQNFSDDSLTECSVCQGRLRKVFNAVGVVFKGSGFYRNDSRTDTKSSEKSGTSEKSESAGPSETSGKPEKSGSSEKSSGDSGGSPSTSEKKGSAAASSSGGSAGSSGSTSAA